MGTTKTWPRRPQARPTPVPVVLTQDPSLDPVAEERRLTLSGGGGALCKTSWWVDCEEIPRRFT